MVFSALRVKSPASSRMYLLEIVSSPAVPEAVDSEAGRLAEEMLAAKFVQGLPVVGIAGGLQNVPVYRRVTGFAARAYEKRSILRRG